MRNKTLLIYFCTGNGQFDAFIVRMFASSVRSRSNAVQCPNHLRQINFVRAFVRSSFTVSPLCLLGQCCTSWLLLLTLNHLHGIAAVSSTVRLYVNYRWFQRIHSTNTAALRKRCLLIKRHCVWRIGNAEKGNNNKANGEKKSSNDKPQCCTHTNTLKMYRLPAWWARIKS